VAITTGLVITPIPTVKRSRKSHDPQPKTRLKNTTFTCVNYALANDTKTENNPKKSVRFVVTWLGSSRVISRMTTNYYLTEYKTYQVNVYHTDKDCNRLRGDPERKPKKYVESKDLDECSECKGTIHKNTYSESECPLCGERVGKLPNHIRNDH